MKTMHNDDNLTYKYTEDPVGDQCYEKRNDLDSTQDLSRQPNLYIMSSYGLAIHQKIIIILIIHLLII